MVRDPVQLKRLDRFEIADVIIAMVLAGMVNAAILIMAAGTFHSTGHQSIATLEEAYKTLEPLLGPAAAIFFGLSLLMSGLSSSTVGTSAGQVIMQGFLKQHIPIWLRRSITIIPSIVVIAIGLDPTRTLVMSQVVLSFGLPFTIIPLLFFTSNKSIMGILVNNKITTIAMALITILIVSLNVYLIFQLIKG